MLKLNALFDAVRASPASYDCVFTARCRVQSRMLKQVAKEITRNYLKVKLRYAWTP